MPQQAIAQRLEALVAPLRRELEWVDVELAAVAKRRNAALAGFRAEETELRNGRRRIVTTLRSLGAPVAPPAKPKGGRGIGEESLELLESYLRANVNGDEFTTTGLLEREDYPLTRSVTRAGLRVLRDAGAVRLLRKERIGDAGAPTEIYKLTSHG
jgi:hypothetical protein